MANRKLIVEVIGDASSLIRSFRSSAAATTTYRRDLASLAVDAKASANAQIKASLSKDARLREEIAVYRAAASAARQGSREQIVAANLANRAQLQLGRSLGVTGRESRALTLSAVNAERSLGRATRGALAGSGVFRALGRSIAFASGGFLAFATAGQFIRSSIDAAKEAQVTQKQLAQQFKASGIALAPYQRQIDETVNRLSALAGIENDELKAGFITIFRTTRDVGTALRDLGTAADLARAKHLGLAQAALIIAKTEAGNTTLLRRQGFQIAKNATAEQALAQLRAAVTGQARAGTTAQERFGAVLHETEQIVGKALLPTLNRYLTSGAHWLQQMNESGRLQRDVAAAGKLVRDAIDAVRTVLSPVVEAFKLLGKAVGGTRNELKLLGAAFVLFKAQAAIAGFGSIVAGLTGVGGAAATSAAQVGVLRTRLLGLKALGVIGVTVAVAFAVAQGAQALSRALGKTGFGKALGAGDIGDFSAIAKAQAHFQQGYLTAADRKALRAAGVPASKFAGLATSKEGAKAAVTRAGRGVPGFDFPSRFAPSAVSQAAKPRGVNLQGLLNIQELKLARAELTPTLVDDRKILVIEAGIVKQQIASAKTLKDRTSLTQQLVGILDRIRGIDQQDAADTKKSADNAKKRTREALAQAKAALAQARQFKLLGLDATGQPLVPSVKALRGELGSISSTIEGTILDTTKTRSVLSRIRRILAGGLGAVGKDVRTKIKEILDGLNQQLKDNPATQKAAGAFRRSNFDQIIAGLGLSPSEVRALSGRLSQLGPTGTVPARGFAAFGVPVLAGAGGETVVHTTINLDGRTVAVNTTRHQQKRKLRNPDQRRGMNPGGGL